MSLLRLQSKWQRGRGRHMMPTPCPNSLAHFWVGGRCALWVPSLPTSHRSLSAFMPRSLAPGPPETCSAHTWSVSARLGQSRSHHLGMSLGSGYMLRQEHRGFSPPLTKATDRFFHTNTSESCLPGSGLGWGYHDLLRKFSHHFAVIQSSKGHRGARVGLSQLLIVTTCSWPHSWLAFLRSLNNFSPTLSVLSGIPSQISQPTKINNCLLWEAFPDCEG